MKTVSEFLAGWKVYGDDKEFVAALKAFQAEAFSDGLRSGADGLNSGLMQKPKTVMSQRIEERLAQAKPKLDAADRHLLRLIRKDRDSHGWAKVSEFVFPFALKLPPELVETRINENGRWIRLTHDGEIVLDWIL